jgi:hypothetical protein
MSKELWSALEVSQLFPESPEIVFIENKLGLRRVIAAL